MAMYQQPEYLYPRRGWMEYRVPITARVIIDCAGRIPILLSPRGEWELPGGKVEAHEQPWQAAQREAREELGAEIRRPELVHAWIDEITRIRHGLRIVYATSVAKWDDWRVSSEHIEWRLIEPALLPGIPMREGERLAVARWTKGTD